MDGGVSSAAVEVLIQNLIDAIKQEYYLARYLDVHVQQLQKTLAVIQAYLNDADKKSIAQDAVKLWLRELESLAFDADNVLDEFNFHLLSNEAKKMDVSNCKDKVLSCFSSFNYTAPSRNTALKIKHINENFESMNKRATELGLQSMLVNAPAAVHASFETDSFTADPIFIGRDDDVDKLVDVVVESPHGRNFSILAIVGMGGLGKTTLTRKVFNHEKIKARFGSLVWVHVSQDFDPIILFKKILSIIDLTSSSSDGVESREVVLKKLKEAFKYKTYLLVLDDVWNEDPHKWGDFINSMSGVTSTEGNAILMSSRNEGVASIVRPLHTHYLSVLSDEDCWSIIKAKAFENGEAPSPGFEMIGREIAARCKGVPLAANVVGGLLRGCKTEEKWHSVNENRLSDVEGGESILKILKLSYDHLASPSLKKCFAYCSIFPKGSQIEKQELIEMWMAEGFLNADRRNEEMEYVGDKFINLLLHNSLLLVSKRDEYGNVSHCVMHDLVHDVASFVLGSSDGTTPPRYMFHVSSRGEAGRIPKQVAKHLRTLVLKGDISDTVFSDFESLHVLTIAGYGAEDEFPRSIRKLIHLRSLNISETWISKLPDWIGELHHLQTLRANAKRLKKMPRTLEYLTNLSHLHINFSSVEFYNNTPSQLPAMIGRLTGLQTLDRFRVGNEKGYGIEELGSLNNLKGKLEICNLEKVGGREEAEKANMSHKPKLLHLKLTWGYSREGETDNDENVLEGLQPHPNLHRLGIQRFKGSKLPSWIEKMAVRNGTQQGSWVPLDKLIEISLWDCSECEEIPMLEHLPNLKSLDLARLKKVRFINSSFTTLTSLRIAYLEALECLPDWLLYNNPNLSKLEIRECPKLSELPNGLQALLSLKELTIWQCLNLKSIGSISSGEGESKPRILSKLWIVECGQLMELPRQMVESWAPSLESVTLDYLSSLENLPIIIECLEKSTTHCLTKLSIRGTPNFMATCTSTSVESWPFKNLQELGIGYSKDWSRENSDGIKEKVDGILQSCSSSLTKLELTGMGDWEALPPSIQHLASLSKLELKNFGMEELPEWLGSLPSLRFLILSKCIKLRRLNLRATAELRNIIIGHCPELNVGSERLRVPNVDISVNDRLW